MLKNILIISSMILITVLVSVPSHAWLIYHKPEFKGKVIDAETKEPIEGAVVVVTYSKETIGIPEHYSSIIEVRETLTNKKGEFYISSYTTIIQPLSVTDMSNFIIFKPGYGSFPNYQTVPANMKPTDQEIFFSEDFGKEREIELWVKREVAPDLKKFKVTFGIVELPKLKTREERVKMGLHSRPDPTIPDSKVKNLMKAINEENAFLGLPLYELENK